MKRILALVLIGLISLGISGCGTMDRLLNNNAKDSFNSLLGLSNTPTVGNEVVGETRSVTVYFADASGKNLVPQEVQIPKTLSLARETLNQLLKGPEAGSNLLTVVPQGTVLLDINIKDDTAIVDLSKEILKTAPKVSSETTVYAFVNTLTQFPTIKQVKFRVEGQPVQKIGTVSTTQALSRNTSAVKKHPITQKPASNSTNQISPDPSGT